MKNSSSICLLRRPNTQHAQNEPTTNAIMANSDLNILLFSLFWSAPGLPKEALRKVQRPTHHSNSTGRGGKDHWNDIEINHESGNSFSSFLGIGIGIFPIFDWILLRNNVIVMVVRKPDPRIAGKLRGLQKHSKSR